MHKDAEKWKLATVTKRAVTSNQQRFRWKNTMKKHAVVLGNYFSTHRERSDSGVKERDKILLKSLIIFNCSFLRPTSRTST